jgi:hypothetical protein
MNSYKRYVNEKMRDIQSKIKPIQPEIPTITIEEKRQEIEEWKQKIHTNPILLPFYLYDWMKQLDMIQMGDTEISRYYAKAIRIRESELRQEAETSTRGRNVLREFLQMKSKNFTTITRDEEIQIESIYKKLVVINKLKESDKENGFKS